MIRVAGNVLDNHQLGSIEYAADHLGAKLIVMLGHTHCGAVASAMEGHADGFEDMEAHADGFTDMEGHTDGFEDMEAHADGFIDYIMKDIAVAIGDEKDDYKATCLNVQHGVRRIRDELKIHPIENAKGLEVIGAIYHTDDGRVEFI